MAESSGKFNLRTYIKNDIDIAILRSRSMEEFYASMRKMGYSLKFGKHFAVSPAGKDEEWRIITKEKNVAIVVLDMPLLDTRKSKDLTGTLIADIVLQLLSYVAQTERVFIRQRQAEGIAAAKERGVRFGRKPMERPLEFECLKEKWRKGEISARAASKKLEITHKTFLTWAREVD